MIVKLLLGVLTLFLLIQLVPYGRDHTNPPVHMEPAWDSPQTRELAVRACYDCHSNETKWLWFHNIAPISWGVQFDVMAVRERLNFSEWDESQSKADESAEVVAQGEMPPFRYVLAHPEANLSDAEREALIQGLLATFGDDLEDGAEEDIEEENNSGNSGPGSGEDDD
ncbi:MAG: heme-binding domain-containing protein [Ardenticatenales bacterium]|nr:heme-binding domain-containing protein [Ardenticatenales bacterium]